MSMRGLGVSADDEQAYRQLLRDPDACLSPDSVRRLASLGLVAVAADGVLTAIDPRSAVDRLIGRRLGQLDEEIAQIHGARSSLPSLLAELPDSGPTELIERIDGRQAAQRKVWQTTRDAGEILAMHRDRPNLAAGILERTLLGLERGTVYRTIVHRDMLATPEIAEYLLTIHRAGDRHRVMDAELNPLIIVDRAVAFVPITPGDAEAGAIMVRQAGVVAILVDLFEHTWSRSTELEPEPDGLSEAERAVLHQLTAYAKDEAAARALGISVRTFRARVAAVMGRLGAANRFQAGVRAQQRGWI
ncbi:helix-turn-helix transcriptional regulator [Hamadaea sp. NPDC050747]|uniref:helix-turn-helix transcriptional regulator n=1 Tax=Hamadaea sp. NPDC050747 TaxID=3155789 RepID=UPI0033D53837